MSFEKEEKHWTSQVKFVRGKSGEEIEKAYNELNTSNRFTISSNIFQTQSGFDAFIFFKELRQ